MDLVVDTRADALQPGELVIPLPSEVWFRTVDNDPKSIKVFNLGKDELFSKRQAKSEPGIVICSLCVDMVTTTISDSISLCLFGVGFRWLWKKSLKRF